MPASIPHIIHLRFTQALTILRSIPEQEVGLQPIPTDRLRFYGLYKQATFGKCYLPKPSSRNVVEYAKWKAWYHCRHHSCMEAKNLYVNLVVELLTEFINRYPNNPHHEFTKHALHILESNVSTGFDGINHAREKSTSFIPGKPVIMTTIQLPPEDTDAEVASYSTSGSWISKSPLPQASTPSSVTTHNINDPCTPISLSPQLHSQKPATPSNKMISTAMDLTISPTASTDAHGLYYTTTSEQFRTLSSQIIPISSSPSSSPLLPASLIPCRKKKAVDHHYRHRHQKSDRHSERKALKKLHEEITILAEKINQLGQETRLLPSSYDGPRLKRHHSMIIKLFVGWRLLLKILFRHLLVNILVNEFIFWILWHQKSPAAHAMNDFWTPYIKGLVRSSIKKTLFWKLKL